MKRFGCDWRLGPRAALLPGEFPVLPARYILGIESASRPSYRVFFPIPPLFEAKVLVTNRRILFLGFMLLRLVRQEFSIWLPGSGTMGEDILTNVSTKGTGIGLNYLEIKSKGSGKPWYRSEALRVRLLLRNPEELAEQIGTVFQEVPAA